MYKSLLNQYLLLPGWHSNFILAAAAAHVSTFGHTCNCPDSLIKALAPVFADHAILHEPYMEELQSFIKLGMIKEIPKTSRKWCSKSFAIH
eukprot:840487-Ditylum_brightwellii.AAC.1